MVTRRTLEKYMGQVPEIAEETKLKPEEVARVLEVVQVHIENGRRQPKPPPPEGGISIRAGSRKYKVIQSTITRWVKRGYIPILLETRNEKYIEEKRLAELALIYKKSPGKGKLTIKQKLNPI